MGMIYYVNFEGKYDYYKLALKIIEELPKGKIIKEFPKGNFLTEIILVQDGKRCEFHTKEYVKRQISGFNIKLFADEPDKYRYYLEEEFKKFLKPHFEEIYFSFIKDYKDYSLHIKPIKNAVYAGFESFIVVNHPKYFLEVFDDLCSVIKPNTVYIYDDTDLERIKKLTKPFKLYFSNDAGKKISLTRQIKKIVKKYSENEKNQ